MKKQAGLPFALLLASLLFACRSTALERDSVLPELAAWMSGSFSSAAQAAEHPDDYRDIRLYMVPIWPERTDGVWLYVEQAAALSLDRPYRQRVYHLVETPDGARSDVYELPGDPLDLAGAWRRPSVLATLSPADLTERTGCSIHLVRENGAYVGSTLGNDCSSTLRGATHATSEVTITPDTLTSWDRGFDASGEQVWGATAGPYEFVKQGDRRGSQFRPRSRDDANLYDGSSSPRTISSTRSRDRRVRGEGGQVTEHLFADLNPRS